MKITVIPSKLGSYEYTKFISLFTSVFFRTMDHKDYKSCCISIEIIGINQLVKKNASPTPVLFGLFLNALCFYPLPPLYHNSSKARSVLYRLLCPFARASVVIAKSLSAYRSSEHLFELRYAVCILMV